MPNLPKVSLVLKVGSPTSWSGRARWTDRRATRNYLNSRRAALSSDPDRLETVTIEIGRDDALILASVHADGRLRLAFGSGEEFVGRWCDLPEAVGDAAGKLMRAAAPMVGLLPRNARGSVPCNGQARLALITPSAVYSEEAEIAELNAGTSPMSPLWRAAIDLLRPMTASLFDPDSAIPV